MLESGQKFDKIKDVTTFFEKSYDRQKVIEQNKKNAVRHAYFREYLALQRLAYMFRFDARNGDLKEAQRMPFTIVRQDITKMKVDAIVNAANTELLMGGGVCGAIFNAAGAKELQEACDKKSPIKTGDAVITPGFKLPAKFVIHAAGPVYICITGTVV